MSITNTNILQTSANIVTLATISILYAMDLLVGSLKHQIKNVLVDAIKKLVINKNETS